ncbi:DUF2243 domain-containing protein [Paenibacillus cellulosilyticus]|nr:DUF2243 domain-containing protein [Paenibacillus cellulosilyticus]QKS46580.1 DUF2243 domain-containing protein [Paenibacillus cellulosilyticus]
MALTNTQQDQIQTKASQNLWSGILFGVGFVGFIDEAVFHQLLHWHHFYDKSTTAAGLVSDGLFHALSFFATIASSFMMAALKQAQAFRFRRWLGGIFLGAGIFQLYDGIVQHKMMRLHQIRYNVDIMPYDVGWNVLAALLIIIGIGLARVNQKQRSSKARA